MSATNMYTNNVNQAHERGDPRRKEWRSEGKREKDIYMKQERVFVWFHEDSVS